MLPRVLRFSMPAITGRLAQLAITAQVGAENESPKALAEKFVVAVAQLIADLGIPATLEALQEADIPALAAAALHEAHTGYPVPRYMTQSQCESLIREAQAKA